MPVEQTQMEARPGLEHPVVGAPCAPHALYPRFGLVLMVTHACNLRCRYCYTGAKLDRSMPPEVGRKAIDRAVESIEQGGVLELGFFGGEPLLQAQLVSALADYAALSAGRRGIEVLAGLTTNGTIHTSDAWSMMARPDLELAVSHDGLPGVHNLHRRDVHGCPTSDRVLHTIHRLLDLGKDFRVVMVVRPDTAQFLSAGVLFLKSIGVRQVEPALDLWTQWTRGDVEALEAAVAACARIWRDGLPDFSIAWFDEKAARLAHVPVTDTARCGFGAGQIAVAPSGRLYPCERLIGEDMDGSPMSLEGDARDGGDFLHIRAPGGCQAAACRGCAIRSLCNADCRCSNYVRTGDVGTPDGLLCALNRACLRETARVLVDPCSGGVG